MANRFDNMGKMANKVGKTLSNNADNMGKMASNVGKTLSNNSDNISKLASNVSKAVSKNSGNVDNVASNVGKALSKNSDKIGKKASKVGKTLSNNSDNISKLANNVSKAVSNNSGSVENVASTVGNALNRNSEKIGKLTSNMGKTINSNSENVAAITQEKMMETLDWAYDRTITGLPGQKDIQELVDDYLSKYDKETAIKKLVNAQTTKAATSGFVSGFGGIITMPVTIPANVTTVILFQMRMIAAIALIQGYNLRSDQVQTFVYATLAGTTVANVMKKSGVVIGNKVLLGVVKKIPGKTLTKINQAVGFRMVTKFGTTGAINLGKAVPVAGALVGGTFDTVTTRTIAKLAIKTFTDEGINVGDGQIINKAVF